MNDFFTAFQAAVSKEITSTLSAVDNNQSYLDEMIDEADKEYRTVTLITETSTEFASDYFDDMIGVDTIEQLKEYILQGRIHHVISYKGELIDTVLDKQVNEYYIVGDIK